MTVTLQKNDLIHEYYLEETTVYKTYKTEGMRPEYDEEKFESQKEAVDWIWQWTLTKLKMGWRVV
jgi:hypothetical protein